MASGKAKNYFAWFLFLGVLVIPLAALYQFLQGVKNHLPVAHPNIVLISIDTCRADSIGCYGNSNCRTPFMDRMSRNSVVFTRGIAQCPTTAPSHATMLSGKDPSIHRILSNGMMIGNSIKLLQEYLGEIGYHTAAFISGYSLVHRMTGLGKGFDQYDDVWSSEKIERPGTETIESAANWLRAIKTDEPFFLWVHLFDPHSPYSPPPIFRNSSEISTQNETDENKHRIAFEKHVETARNAGDFNVLLKDPTTLNATPDEIRRNWYNYLEEISTVDQCLSVLFREINNSVQSQNTFCILTSDHGEGFEKGYYFGHGDRLWESSIAVPFIIKSHDPRIHASVIDAAVHHIDVLPTILNVCRIQTDRFEFPGMNLMDLIRHQRFRTEPFLFSSAPPLPRKNLSQGLVHAVYDSRFKLIWSVNRSEFALYDLLNDPGETIDEQSKYPKVFSSLKQVINRRQNDLQYPLDAIAPGQLSNRETNQLKTLGYLDDQL